jgi:hypothetical protein
VVEQIRDVELIGQASVDGLHNVNFTQDELGQIKDVSLNASRMLTGSISSSTATGIAAYGGAYGAVTFLGTSVGVASTGTAISGLYGAAANSALLAYFGGGSLAAGGFGMAGGAVVLGGIALGPAIAVGGFLLHAKSREDLAKAEVMYYETLDAVEKMGTITTLLNSIKRVSDEYQDIITMLDNRMNSMTARLQIAVNDTRLREREYRRNCIKRQPGIITPLARLITFEVKIKIDDIIGANRNVIYSFMANDEKQLLHTSYQAAQIMKKLLETPLLDENGNITMQCRSVLNEGAEFFGH